MRCGACKVTSLALIGNETGQPRSYSAFDNRFEEACKQAAGALDHAGEEEVAGGLPVLDTITQSKNRMQQEASSTHVGCSSSAPMGARDLPFWLSSLSDSPDVPPRCRRGLAVQKRRTLVCSPGSSWTEGRYIASRPSKSWVRAAASPMMS